MERSIESGIRPRALVCVADPDLGAALVSALETAGFFCERALDAVDAVAAAVSRPCGLIVADAAMPRIEALLLALRLREAPFRLKAKLVVLAPASRMDVLAGTVVTDALVPTPVDLAAFAANARHLRQALLPRGATWTRPVRANTPSSAGGPEAIRARLQDLGAEDLCRIARAAGLSGKASLAASQGGARGVLAFKDGEVSLAYVIEGRTTTRGAPARAILAEWRSGELSLEVETARATEATPVPPDPPSGGAAAEALPRIGPFEIVEPLARTSFASTFRARWAGAPRSAAAADVHLVVGATPEAPASHPARLEVPGLSREREWGRLPDGRVWSAADLPAGPTLEDAVREDGPLGVLRALAVFEAVLDSLAQAEAQGFPVGHLDGRSILLPTGERPVILDHSPFAAPRSCGALYSAGVLLSFAITGQVPGSEGSPDATRPPSLRAAGVPDVGNDLEDLIATLTATRPAARYPSAAIAHAVLQNVRHRALVASPPSAECASVPAPSGYRHIRKLGAGGTGAVFEAVHETLLQLVAVKVIRPKDLDPTVRRRFVREARLSSSLRHEGVVRVLDAREEHGCLFLVMERVEGESLGARLERRGPIAEAEALPWFRSLLEPLGFAHDRGVIHRDVKPDNVLMALDGTPKLADFGLAKSLVGERGPTTQRGTIGTPYYMSPEQCLGAPVDGRADLYSLGATFFHVLAGRPPFPDPSSLAVLAHHLNTPAPSLESMGVRVSRATAAVVRRLLEKEPADRYQRAADALAALPGGAPDDATPRRAVARCGP